MLPLTVLVAHFLKAWVRFIVVTTFTFSWTWIFFISIWYLFYPSLTTSSSSAAPRQSQGGAGASGPNGLPGLSGGLIMDPNASRAFGTNTMQIFPELPLSSV